MSCSALRAAFLLSASLLYSSEIWAEESQVRRPSKYGDIEIGYRGLTCGQCMYTLIDYCPNIPKADAVVLVQGTKPLTSEKKCAAPMGYSDYVPCRNTALQRFETIKFIKNVDRAVGKDDVFAAEYESGRNDPERKTGVLLDPVKTYVIIVARRPREFNPKADWTIYFACEVPSTDLDQGADKQTSKGGN